VEQVKKTLEMDPNYAQEHGQFARIYLNMGKYDLWLDEWKKSTTLYKQTDEFGDCRGGRPRLFQVRV
jgi:Tfp pilus assembly protein PilF